MKASTLIGVILTLLMLLLVMVASFVFVFQGRQQLLARNETLEGTLGRTEVQLSDSIATRTAMVQAVATAESASLQLEGQLVQSQQEVDALTQSLNQLQQTQAEVLARPPQVDIVSPVTGARLFAGTPVQIAVAAADTVGITAVTITLNEQPLSVTTHEAQPLVNVVESWTPIQGGEVVLSVSASNGEESSVVTRTLSINAATNIQPSANSQVAFAVERGDITANVMTLRGILAARPVTIVAVPAAELPQRSPLALFDLSDESATAVWQALDFDEAMLTVDVPQASAYSAADNSLYLLEGVTEFDALTQYEYIAAITRLLLNQRVAAVTEGTLDAALARYALIEGEAALMQQQYLAAGYFTDVDRSTILAQQEAETGETAVTFFRDTGLALVSALFENGGLELLNAVEQSLPMSTEQVLHVDKLSAAEPPLLVTLPPLQSALGADWQLLLEDSLGEAMLRLYLGQQLNADQTETAASGWGGDRIAVYQQAAGDTVLVWRIAWDTPDDSTEFAALYPNYATRLLDVDGEIQPDGAECWLGAVVICLTQRDTETLIVRAPDLATVVSVAAFVP